MLILASTSTSRKNLLKNADIKFIQLSSFFDESLIIENNIKDLALKLSFSKAEVIKNKIKEINLNEKFNLTSIEILGCDSRISIEVRLNFSFKLISYILF